MPPFNPDPHGDPSFRPQFPIRPSDLREMLEMAKAANRTADTGGMGDSGGGMGTQIASPLVPPGFYARLSAPPLTSLPLYNFCEVMDDGTGSGWIPANGAMEGQYLPDTGTYNAYPLSGSSTIPIPGPPTAVEISPTSSFAAVYYVITATWTSNATGASLQSGESLEVSSDTFGTLSWTAPASVAGYTLTGFTIWRGETAGGENVLVASVSSSTTTYADTGDFTSEGSPIAGGNVGPIVWMIPISAWNYFKFIDIGSINESIAWVKATSSTPSTIYLGRTITDGMITGGTTLTSNSANFTSTDTGDTVIGTGIPGSTTISAINSTTATLSNTSTNGTGLTIQIVSGTTTGYAAVIDAWSNKDGTWSDGATVWLLGANTELPQVGVRYQCRLLGVDDMNVQIWGVSAEWASLAVVNSTTLHGTYYLDGNLVTLTPGQTTGGAVWLIDAT